MDGCCVLSLLSTTCTRPTAFLHHAASRVGNISRLIQLCGLGLVNCWAVFFRKTTTRFFRLSMCHFLALCLFAALDCRLYVFTFFRLLCLRSGGGGGEGGREGGQLPRSKPKGVTAKRNHTSDIHRFCRFIDSSQSKNSIRTTPSAPIIISRAGIK